MQGTPTERARLQFVKNYYEFGPKALYSDGRTADDGKAAPEPAAPVAPAAEAQPAEAQPAAVEVAA
jgi:hypothetical protein